MFLLDSLTTALVLVVLPLTVLAHFLGWLRSPGRRWTWLVGSGVVLLVSSPWGDGTSLGEIKRFNGWLCAITALWIFLRQRRFFGFENRRFYFAVLSVTALLAVGNYINFFAFHGARTYIQLHDVAHYYLGSKYFDEVGYRHLYTAMVRAESELSETFPPVTEVRDLSTNDITSVPELLGRGGDVKTRFSTPRWARFLADVSYFRRRIEPASYERLLLDHGYNATPFWTLVGGTLSRQIDVATDRSLLWLTLIDPLLILILLVAVGRSFGVEIALLCTIFFAVVFGATFGWTGGAFLRHGWFFLTGLSLCALKHRRMRTAGGLLALAALLKIFPAALAAGSFALAGHDIRREKAIGRDRWRYIVTFLLVGILGLAVTGWTSGGLGRWAEFRANTSLHLENIAPNLVSLVQVAAYRADSESQMVTEEEFGALKVRRLNIRRQILLWIFPMSLLFFVWKAGRLDDLEASVMGILLLFVGLDLAGYYYVLMMFLILAFRKFPLAWIIIFASEALLYSLVVFEDHLALQFVFRCVMLGWLLAMLYPADKFFRSARGSDLELPPEDRARRAGETA